jgi:hypothetical protein
MGATYVHLGRRPYAWVGPPRGAGREGGGLASTRARRRLDLDHLSPCPLSSHTAACDARQALRTRQLPLKTSRLAGMELATKAAMVRRLPSSAGCQPLSAFPRWRRAKLTDPYLPSLALSLRPSSLINPADATGVAAAKRKADGACCRSPATQPLALRGCS